MYQNKEIDSQQDIEFVTQKFKRICKSHYFLDRFRKLNFKVLNGTFYEGVELDPTSSKFKDILIQVVEKDRFSDRSLIDFDFRQDLEKLKNLQLNQYIHTIKDFMESKTNFYLIYDQLKNYNFLETYTDNQSNNYKFFSEEEIITIQDQLFQGLQILMNQDIWKQLIITQHILYSIFYKKVKLLAPCFMISNINTQNQLFNSKPPSPSSKNNNNSPLKHQNQQQLQQIKQSNQQSLHRSQSQLDINHMNITQQKELNEYIPPEVYNCLLKQEKSVNYNEKHYSWSYGIFLYKLAYGIFPFEELDIPQVNSMQSINFSQQLQKNIKKHENSIATTLDHYQPSSKIKQEIQRFLQINPNQRPDLFENIKTSIVFVNSVEIQNFQNIISKHNLNYNDNKVIMEEDDENRSNMDDLQKSQEDMLGGKNIIKSVYQQNQENNGQINMQESEVQSMLQTNQYSYIKQQQSQSQTQKQLSQNSKQYQQLAAVEKSGLGSEIIKLGGEFDPFENAQVFDYQFSQSIDTSQQNIIVQKYYAQLYHQQKIIEFLSNQLPELEALKKTEEYTVDLDKAQLALLKYGILKYQEIIKKLENKDKQILVFESEVDCQSFWVHQEYQQILTKFKFNKNNLVNQFEEIFEKLNNENLMRSSKITSNLYNENAIQYFLSNNYNLELDKVKYPYRQCLFKIEKKLDETSSSLFNSSLILDFEYSSEINKKITKATNLMQLCLKLTHCLIPTKIFVHPYNFEIFYLNISQKDYKTLKSEKDQLMNVFFPKYSQALTTSGLNSNINQNFQ